MLDRHDKKLLTQGYTFDIESKNSGLLITTEQNRQSF
jgi:hypothetical protein